MAKKCVILAGGTGDLGLRTARAILSKGAEVCVLTRSGGPSEKIAPLARSGAKVLAVDYNDSGALVKACRGGHCVVSTLSGLRHVIIDVQKRLLDAAVAAKIERFIPSDFSIDFTTLPDGSNRNLDLRREFHRHLDQAPITATTIFNGAFMDLLSGEAPFILNRIRRVLYYGDADQLLDFTTKDDTARYIAEAALDGSTPRFLRIAGDQTSARRLAEIAGRVAGKRYRLLCGGSLGMLRVTISMAKAFSRKTEDLYPAWQGMQYMHNMYGGAAALDPLDNDRYPKLRWTTVEQFLRKYWRP